MKIVCTFSGGLDSTVLLHYLLSKGHEVVAVSFDYGQRHSIELEYAKRTTDTLKVEHRVLSLLFLQTLSSDSMLLGGEGSPIVPCRNTLMITSAWALAETLNAGGVAIGAHAGDALDFPDCRPVFLKSLENTLQIGSGKQINLWSPFIHMSKKDIVNMGRYLNVDFDSTYTCYKGGEIACGECASCVGRINALGD